MRDDELYCGTTLKAKNLASVIGAHLVYSTSQIMPCTAEIAHTLSTTCDRMFVTGPFKHPNTDVKGLFNNAILVNSEIRLRARAGHIVMSAHISQEPVPFNDTIDIVSVMRLLFALFLRMWPPACMHAWAEWTVQV